LLILFDVEAKADDVVLVPDTEDSATESSSDNESKSGSSVTESVSEDDLGGDYGSLSEQFQSEV
jgi:hypothetical protein